MKIPLLFSLFAFLMVVPCLSQEIEHVKVGGRQEETTFFPHIGRYYEGEIPVSVLGDPEGIQVGKGWEVVSFCISYPCESLNKTTVVTDFLIPERIIRDIIANSLGQMIFITNIVARDAYGNTANPIPMNLIPVRQ